MSQFFVDFFVSQYRKASPFLFFGTAKKFSDKKYGISSLL